MTARHIFPLELIGVAAIPESLMPNEKYLERMLRRMKRGLMFLRPPVKIPACPCKLACIKAGRR
jgi:hypothetical protein